MSVCIRIPNTVSLPEQRVNVYGFIMSNSGTNLVTVPPQGGPWNMVDKNNNPTTVLIDAEQVGGPYGPVAALKYYPPTETDWDFSSANIGDMISGDIISKFVQIDPPFAGFSLLKTFANGGWNWRETPKNFNPALPDCEPRPILFDVERYSGGTFLAIPPPPQMLLLTNSGAVASRMFTDVVTNPYISGPSAFKFVDNSGQISTALNDATSVQVIGYLLKSSPAWGGFHAPGAWLPSTLLAAFTMLNTPYNLTKQTSGGNFYWSGLASAMNPAPPNNTGEYGILYTINNDPEIFIGYPQ